jgi:hypothetical protein
VNSNAFTTIDRFPATTDFDTGTTPHEHVRIRAFVTLHETPVIQKDPERAMEVVVFPVQCGR